MIVPASEAACREAAALLKQGGLIAFPTETYYGLGVDPFNAEALRRLFAAKRRAENKPVLVLVHEQTQVPLLAAEMPDALRLLMSGFWPGPLTLVFPAKKDVPELLTGGTGTVGIRHSPDVTATRLLQAFGRPVTATSANRSGEKAAVTAAAVEATFGNELDLILDGGRTPGSAGSTLIGMEAGHPVCFRAGRISFAEIAAFLAAAERKERFFSDA